MPRHVKAPILKPTTDRRNAKLSDDPKLGKSWIAMKAWLDVKYGTVAEPVFASGGATPTALMYKVMGKMFAILTIRSTESVILKCDPDLAVMLREKYAGVGRRSHLDPRYWICITLDSDVSNREIKQLLAQSYELVCSTLTRKQKAELANAIAVP